MYAIIRTGGKQARVSPGDVIQVELLKQTDETVSFTPLLVVDDAGTSISDRKVLAGVSVHAKVLGEAKGPKVDIFKYKNKTGYRRRMGHRQRYTSLEVTGIDLPESPAKPAAKSAAKPAAKSAAKPAAKSPAKPAAKSPAKPAAKSPAKPAAKPAAKAATKAAAAAEEE